MNYINMRGAMMAIVSCCRAPFSVYPDFQLDYKVHYMSKFSLDGNSNSCVGGADQVNEIVLMPHLRLEL